MSKSVEEAHDQIVTLVSEVLKVVNANQLRTNGRDDRGKMVVDQQIVLAAMSWIVAMVVSISGSEEKRMRMAAAFDEMLLASHAEHEKDISKLLGNNDLNQD